MILRIYMGKCKLCQINKADKKNSHTIPKFFGKTMLRQDDDKFMGYVAALINGATVLSSKKIQDIHKEDFIFCSSCESDLGKLETFFSNQIYNKLTTLKQETPIKADDWAFFKIPISSFLDIKLLIYSVIWRANLNPNEYPQSHLGNIIAENLRHSITQRNINDNFSIWMIYSPDNKPNDNIINAIQNEKVSTLFLNELIIFVSFDSANQSTFFPENLAINQTDCPIILLSQTDWENIKMFFLKESIKWVNNK